MKYQESKQLFSRSKNLNPGGVHSPVRSFKSVGIDPIFFDSAQGAYLHSVDGQEFIDFCQSFGPNILGHRDRDVQDAVESMLNKVWTLGACDPYSVELSQYIVDNVAHVEKVRFVCSGTEAVMTALRVARAATGRQKIINKSLV